MKLYIAGENPHGVDPNTPRERCDRDIYDFVIKQGTEFSRLVSFFYKQTIQRNIKLKGELDGNKQRTNAEDVRGSETRSRKKGSR